MDKSRGKDHRFNKSKYKEKKYTVLQKTLQAKSQTKLAKAPLPTDTNWDRYEFDEEENEELQPDSSTDFTLLANAPVKQGSHFQFKSDKTSAQELSSVNLPKELFNLDLNLLNLSVASIPFYRRIDLDDSYFTNEQKLEHEKVATSFLREYTDLVEGENYEGGHIEGSVQEINSRIIDLLLDESDSEKVAREKKPDNDELDDWLDNVLDDI